MTTNPLARRRAEPANDAAASRPIIRATGDHLTDLIATANANCARPELEWFNDGQGALKLGYRAEWSRWNTRQMEDRLETERARFTRRHLDQAGT